MRNIKDYRVFIASPGGLDEIRKAFREEVRKFSDSAAMRRGMSFTPVGRRRPWEGIGIRQRPARSQVVAIWRCPCGSMVAVLLCYHDQVLRRSWNGGHFQW